MSRSEVFRSRRPGGRMSDGFGLGGRAHVATHALPWVYAAGALLSAVFFGFFSRGFGSARTVSP